MFTEIGGTLSEGAAAKIGKHVFLTVMDYGMPGLMAPGKSYHDGIGILGAKVIGG
jgi:hypothetical protein